MSLRFKDQGPFAPVSAPAEKSRPKMKAQLHRHVEPRHASRIDLDPRKIVYPPVALANHRGDLADPDLRPVGRIKRATRMVARRDDRKDHRAKNCLEPLVERAIDENGLGGWRLRRASVHRASARTLPAARRG